MNLLFRVVYAAHATGTHHKLALDALRHLQGADAEAWQRLVLSHAKLYLEGSKAPDNEFKDFKNHVLHTRDGYWGGAPEQVRNWYRQLVEALAQQDWPVAVRCAGVLSHYYTDPLMPFHTAQSEAENNIHRATEWSISKAYDALALQGETEFADLRVELPAGPNWLAQLVCQGAERANRYYEKLIAHYDIKRGVVDPPAGPRCGGAPAGGGDAALRHARLRRRARSRHRRGQRARPERAPGGRHAGGDRAGSHQADRAPHRRRRGAPPGRAHVRRADCHGHGGDASARGRPAGARCARRGGAGQARRRRRRYPRCSPSRCPSRPARAPWLRGQSASGAMRRPPPTSCPCARRRLRPRRNPRPSTSTQSRARGRRQYRRHCLHRHLRRPSQPATRTARRPRPRPSGRARRPGSWSSWNA